MKIIANVILNCFALLFLYIPIPLGIFGFYYYTMYNMNETMSLLFPFCITFLWTILFICIIIDSQGEP